MAVILSKVILKLSKALSQLELQFFNKLINAPCTRVSFRFSNLRLNVYFSELKTTRNLTIQKSV